MDYRDVLPLTGDNGCGEDAENDGPSIRLESEIAKESNLYADSNFTLILIHLKPWFVTPSSTLPISRISGPTPHLASLSLAHRPTLVFESNNPTLPITKLPNNQTLVMILIRSLDLIMVPSKQEYFILWKCTSSGSNIYKMKK